MDKKESPSAKLSRTIRELEQQQETEKQNFLNGYSLLKEGMRPKNLLREGFERIKKSPGVRGKAIAALVSIAGVVATRKLIKKKLEKPQPQHKKEQLSHVSHIAEPVSKLLRPVVAAIATNWLSKRKTNQKT